MTNTALLRPEALAWAKRLVRINTVSANSNLPLIECIADHLRSLHVPLRLTYDDARGKANLFATLGAGKPGGLVLSGHTDTVPWDGQNWSLVWCSTLCGTSAPADLPSWQGANRSDT